MTYLSARQRLKAIVNSLNVSELGDESLDTFSLAPDDHLRKHSSMGSSTGCSSDPPFGCSKVGCVNDEFVGIRVEGSRRF